MEIHASLSIDTGSASGRFCAEISRTGLPSDMATMEQQSSPRQIQSPALDSHSRRISTFNSVVAGMYSIGLSTIPHHSNTPILQYSILPSARHSCREPSTLECGRESADIRYRKEFA
jgi:hypothetical protein